MFASKKTTLTIRSAASWALMIVMLCFATACNDDTIGIDPAEGEYATVVLTIKTPGNSLPRPVQRSVQTSEETVVSNVKVLVLKDQQENGTYTYDYMANGTQLENQPNLSSRFQVLLRSSDVPLKLILLANAQEAFSTYTPAQGASEESVRTAINLTFPPGGFATNLPMYGEVTLPNLTSSSTTILDATILRAIARVDVVKALETSSPEFTLREVHVFRANNNIQVIPNNVTANGAIRVTAPSVPAGTASLAQPLIKSSATATDSIGGIYVPEAISVSEGQQMRLNATTVVVGGIFAGDTKISYYRVDFDSRIQGHPFGQVLRNFLYRFTIQKVTARGWTTAEEAAVNLASSMTVEVQPWEDFTTGMYFGDNYFGVSTRQVDVPFLPNYTQVVDVESTMNYEMQWVDGTPSEVVSETGVPLTNGYFTATIVRSEQESPNLSHIRIESPQYNTSDQPVQHTLRLTANDTSVDIVVTKESQMQYSGRPVRVLSMGASYGSLGAFNSTVTFTVGMRNIMDVNFSLTSSYPFQSAGFFFLTVPLSDPAYSNAATPAAVASFKKLIQNFDVLVMTYQNVTSTQVANMLLDEWLVEVPNRVLWVMRDDATSNVAILNRTAQDGEGVWGDIGNAFDATAAYRYSNPDDYAFNNAQEVYEFFNGPFGSVNAPGTNQILRPGDILAGASQISNSAKQYVTPLVYSNKPGYTDYMSIGVNKKRGIVYQGECQVFQTEIGMSTPAANNGTITATPDANGRYYYDVLMANMWAWVTGRVIYGPAPEPAGQMSTYR